MPVRWGNLASDKELASLLEQIAHSRFSPREPGLFQPIVDNLTTTDQYFILADFRAYIRCQEAVSREYADDAIWTRKSIANIAGTGFFSSDRSIKEYAQKIWKTPAVRVAPMV